jgi:hypothetical protein
MNDQFQVEVEPHAYNACNPYNCDKCGKVDPDRRITNFKIENRIVFSICDGCDGTFYDYEDGLEWNRIAEKIELGKR